MLLRRCTHLLFGDVLRPGFNDLPRAKGITLPVQPYNYLKDKFPNLSRSGLDLLNRYEFSTLSPLSRLVFK
jgi:hypothetical protein